MMGIIVRGVKDAFRNVIRTVSITLILALSITTALIMLLAYRTIQTKITSVKSSIGNTISVTPAGVRGLEGGGELLTTADASAISGLPHVVKISKVISDRLTNGQDTNLQSAIDPGSFGGRQQQRQNQADSSRQPRNITMPIMAVATDDLGVTANLNVSQLNVTSGALFDAASADNIALVGSDLATKNNLSVNATFKGYSQDIKIVGVFDGGNRFANNMIIMPLKSLQQLSGQTDQVSAVTVQTDSIDSLASVQKEIKDKLADKADVVSQQDTSSEALKPLENIRSISLYSLIGSVIAGAVIIFLTMLMIVRERKREIGILKAIGSSNARIMTQFAVESMTLTIMSSLVAIILGFILSNPVLKMLINSSQSAVSQADRGGGLGRNIARFGGNAQNTLRDIHAVVGYDIILYGLLAALVIALLGGIIPSFFIAKIRPAEAMRED